MVRIWRMSTQFYVCRDREFAKDIGLIAKRLVMERPRGIDNVEEDDTEA
jgi:hypothetical protein